MMLHMFSYSTDMKYLLKVKGHRYNALIFAPIHHFPSSCSSSYSPNPIQLISQHRNFCFQLLASFLAGLHRTID